MSRSAESSGRTRARALPEFCQVSAGMLAPAVAVLRAEGHDVGSLLEAEGLTAEELSNPTRRIGIQAATRVWQAALRKVPDPNFGLRAALLVDRGDADVLSCLGRSCGTLEEALQSLVRFGRLLDESLECRLHHQREGCFLSLGGRTVHYLPAVAEYAALRIVLGGRQMLGRQYGLLEVHFAHRKPGNVHQHRRMFQAPLRFEQKAVGLLLDRKTLTAPIPSADPVLKQVLTGYAERLMGATASSITTSQRVRDAMVDLLAGGFPTRADVARRLGVAERTLARALEAEKTNFTSLVDELRLELALRRLQDERVSIGAVAAELGFKDQSAFTKFFKRCTRDLPHEYRRRYRFRPSP